MDISVKHLKIHLDERGYIYEMLRCDDSAFIEYGQTYCNMTTPGTIKGFHLHYDNIDNITCVSGAIKLVLIHVSHNQPEIREFFLSIENPIMVTVPAGVWHAWKCISKEPALIINSSSKPFDSLNTREERTDPINNPWGYEWELKHG